MGSTTLGCTVIMNGNAIRSCVTPVSAAQNHPVTTLEGLGSTKKMHKIQQAFVDEQVAGRGYGTDQVGRRGGGSSTFRADTPTAMSLVLGLLIVVAGFAEGFQITRTRGDARRLIEQVTGTVRWRESVA